MVDTCRLRVRRLRDDARLPAYAHEDDAGMDLRTVEALALAPGERAAAPTGLAIELEAGHVGLVHPRSGLARRHGLTVANAPGTVDAGYRGEVQVLLVNLGAEPVELAAGDRVAQLVVQRVSRAEVVEVDALEGSARGAGGFGSTGTG